MSKLAFKEYTDGYSIGEIDANGYITGFGYMYWSDDESFAIGKFKSSEKDGWIASNGDADGNNDRMYFSRWKNGDQTEGVAMVSSDDVLWFCETDKNGDYCGYQFSIWKDGSWRYEYNDKESKAVYYDTDNDTLYMVCLNDGEVEWKKAIAKEKVEKYGLPFQYFEPKSYKNAKFKVDENRITSNGEGPSYIWDGKQKSTTIFHIENSKANGISYFDVGDRVLISQVVNNKSDGGCFMVDKNTYWYKYMYFNNGVQGQMEVIWFPDTCAIEIRKFAYEDKNRYDIIQIDKDFNVWIAEGYSSEEDNLIWRKSFDFDEVYEGVEVEEDEEEKPKTKKTKVKKEDSDEDWAEELRNLFK